jgi:acetoin utilization deacetylase AcuC-like enzyme
VVEGLQRAGLLDRLGRVDRRSATEEELLLCHTREYLRTARRDVEAGQGYLSTGDTDITANSWEVAVMAVGGALNAVDAVMTGAARNVFCAVRPPGHHATPSRGMGFCLLNSVAIAARYAQRRHGVERVLIVDWDVHHGNGTQDIFYEQSDVLYVSLHGNPDRSYPYFSGFADECGEKLGKGFNHNVPLPAGVGDDEYRKYLGHALDRVRKFKPWVVVVSLGLDIFTGDPLSDIGVSSPFFGELGRTFCNLGVPVLGVLEGGYDMADLAENGANFIEAMARAA